MSNSRLAAALILLAATSAPVVAFDYVVTRYDDPPPGDCLADDCSLREAVNAANVSPDLDRVLLSAGTYELTIANPGGVDENASATGDLDVTASLELIGPGATMTTIDANGIDRPLTLFGNPDKTILIRGVTLTGGANTAPSGLQLSGGAPTIEECELVDNGLLTGVPAVFITSGTDTVMRRTTIRENSGSGISAVGSSVTLENVTLSDNGAFELQALSAATIHCRHCTLVSTSGFSAVSASGSGTTVDLANSVVVGACTAASGGVLDSLGGNVESTGDVCGFDQGTDQASVTALALDLGALADYGGPTATHRPGVDGAVDGGANDALCLATDQRGVAREGTECESGSVELTFLHVATPIFHDGFLQGDAEAWSGAVGYVP